ncbi:hypothetical protein EJB05_45686 [Eragrostis curvula]|uniref:3-mercaptopyruvate sulfurtransferase n=1 Tax=Eragrostis curvula TaxID=38414 RepID=A0A5J9TL85_9POAL|nr:hypothetical protein EJB05_45686 [Eragrostis curvula]
MSAHRSNSPATLVVSGKFPEDQELLASAASSLSFGEEEGGGEITVVLSSDAPVAGKNGGFDAGAYMEELRARRFGRWMLWSPRLASTQDLVVQNSSKLPVGVVCVADVQFKGRGRSKNIWESPPGCLMFSFTSQMQDARKLPLTQYVVCLSMTEAIKELCRAKGLPELDVRIKWPNDLYLKGLKVGGILCMSSYESKVYNICTGIGLNVDNEEPTTCLNAAIKEVMTNSPILKREDIMASFFNKFELLFEMFSNQGVGCIGELELGGIAPSSLPARTWHHMPMRLPIAPLRAAPWHRAAAPCRATITRLRLTSPRRLRHLTRGPAYDAFRAAIPRGLTPTGYLYAIGQDGQSYVLHPDGNSFDFFKGLLARTSAMAQDDPVVSAQWLHQHLGLHDVKVLDASWYMPEENRDPWQEYQMAHIRGALFFDIDGIVDRTTDLPHMLPSKEAFAAAVSALDIRNQDKVIIYDGKGFFSAPRVWWMFRVFGHSKVWVLDGGLPQWRASGFDLGSNINNDAILKSKAANNAVETVYNGGMATTITFQAEFQPQLFWTLEKVRRLLLSEKWFRMYLLDYSNDIELLGSCKRFDGVAPEPRKGVRSGHIPGSICVPFPEGLHRVGKHDIPVYDGSWTEWEAQPDSDYPKVTATAS